MLYTAYHFTGQREESGLGIYDYHARWYDPALGRFLQADSLVPDLGEPQACDRYAYAYNNPLKYIDPDGHCPAPPKDWGPAICVALFIEPSEVKAGPFRLHGDGRGFSANSDPAASRGYIWVSPDGSKHQSEMNPSGYISGPFPGDLVSSGYTVWFDPSDDNTWTVSTSEDGSIIIGYDLVVSGPLDASGTAPHINGTITFSENGSGGFDYSFDRDGFPWAEAYYYDGKGGVQTIFQDPAVRGNPHDLFAIEPNQDWRSRLVQSFQTNIFRYGEPQSSKR